MATKKVEWADLASELCADLLGAVDVEDLAKATGLNPNTVYCFGYKTKSQVPNLAQFGMMLEAAQEADPHVVVKVMKKLGARFGVFAESLEVLGQEVHRHNGH